MAVPDSIRPLSQREQLFFQKLLVWKVVSESQLKTLWSSTDPNHEATSNRSRSERSSIEFDSHILKVINQSIKPAFGLEIRSVSLSLQGQENNSYYAIINLRPDLQAQTYACPHLTKQNPHLLALFHLILQRLIDSSSNNDGLKSRKLGLGSTLSRMEMINMRMELMEDKDHEGKVPLVHAESLVSWLEEQHWMVPVLTRSQEDDDDEEEEEDNTMVRKRKRSSVGGNSTRYQLGPRAYMEFPDFLVKAGMNRDGLPQSILY